MANRLQESKDSAKAQQNKKKGKTAAKAKQRQKSPAASRQAQLRKEIEKRMASKGKGGGRGGKSLVVIPAAFGRDTQGTDALQALRAKMALIS